HGQGHGRGHLGRDGRRAGSEKKGLDHAGACTPSFAGAQAFGPLVAPHSPVVDSTRTPVVRGTKCRHSFSRGVGALSRSLGSLTRPTLSDTRARDAVGL